ncbi:MFS general substrate transporter, partial [Stipitochalara longipes BDJ]
DPRNWPIWRKWMVTLIVSSISLCSTYTSSVYTTTYDQLIHEFHTSKEVVTLGLSLYVLGLGLGPMLLAPLSEFFGRRPIYLTSWAGFVVWLIPCAVAQNIQTMLVARFFNGMCGSGFMSVAGGTVGDLFNVHELALPMMVYTASPFLGPELGPIIGGFICQNADWRWVYYVLIIWSAVAYVAIVFLVPETYEPILLKQRLARESLERSEESSSLPAKSGKDILSTVAHSCLRPMQLLIFEPMCLALCTFSAVILGILYLFFEAFPLVFGGVYGFSLEQSGLSFIGLLIGMSIGLATNPFWDRHYENLFAKSLAHPPPPELRLPPAMAGSILIPVGIFWFAWTARSSIHWIVPIIGTSVFGIGVLLTFSGIFTFLVDAYPQFAASGLASNSFLRSCFAAGFPLFAVQMYQRLGNPWATSLLGFIAVACAPFPFLFFRYGATLRERSRFA